MKKYKIYKRINPIDPNQIYIGVTKNSVKSRMHSDLHDALHCEKHSKPLKPLYVCILDLHSKGLKMTHEILDETDDCRQAEQLETQYIQEYIQLGFNLLNVHIKQTTYHGKNGGEALTCSSYTLEGEFVKSYSSIAEAANDLNVNRMTIFRVCNNTKISCKNLQWRFGTDTNSIDPVRKCKLHVPISQYDLEGKFVKTHKSMLAAAKSVGLDSSNSIYVCLDNPGHQSADYQWRTKYTESIDPFKKRRTKSTSLGVQAFDKITGEFKGSFPTATEGLEALGVVGGDRSAVIKCCKGTLPTYKGYIWKYNTSM